MIGALKDSLESQQQRKMVYLDFIYAMSKLCTNEEQYHITASPEYFTAIPFCEWEKTLVKLITVKQKLSYVEKPITVLFQSLDGMVPEYDRQSMSYFGSFKPEENRVMAALQTVNLRGPSNLQLLLAIYLIGGLVQQRRRQKQAWTLQAGVGKSRIIATAALIALEKTDLSAVHIVTPNSHLAMRDEEDYSSYFELDGHSSRVHYHHSPYFHYSPQDLIIVDEADYQLHMHPQQVSTILGHDFLILLSATTQSAENNDTSLARDVFSRRGVKLYRFNFPGSDSRRLCIDDILESLFTLSEHVGK